MENSTLALIQVIPAFLIITIIYIGYLRLRNIRQLRERGLTCLQAMRSLITHIQKHRGLSTRAHSGDAFFRDKIIESQNQVSRDFDHILNIGEWLNDHPEWHGITQHWARLVGNIYSIPLTSGFEQHSRLIANVLVFIDDLTVKHELHTLSHKHIQYWRKLLTLSELIAQARGIGTSVSAIKSNEASSALEGANKKLEVLSQKILHVLEEPQCSKVLDGDELQCLLDFLIFINKNVLMENPSISSSTFFEKSTETLNVLFDKMDDQLQEVYRLIN